MSTVSGSTDNTCTECFGMGRVVGEDSETIRERDDGTWSGVLTFYTETCRHCIGTGIEPEKVKVIDCDLCGGTGSISVVTCWHCGGTGKLRIVHDKASRCAPLEAEPVHEQAKMADGIRETRAFVCAHRVRTVLESAVNNGDMVDLKFRTGTSLTCLPTAVGYGSFAVGNNTYWIAEVKSARVVDVVKSDTEPTIYDKLQAALEASRYCRRQISQQRARSKGLYTSESCGVINGDYPEPPDMTLQSRLLWLAINHDKEQGAFIRGLICGATGCTKPEASDITGVWGASSAELLDQLTALWRKVHNG